MILVFSFMSNFGNNRDAQKSPPPATPTKARQDTFRQEPPRQNESATTRTPPTGAAAQPVGIDGESPQARPQRERSSSRPVSMIQTYQPALMDVSQDTLPELQPIFTFLNSHANKLYQEGYFLKLDDQNIRKVTPSHQLSSSNVSQTETQMLIAPGPSASRSWWEQYCRCGMLPTWILLAKMGKFFQSLSISPMRQSRW
jgi:hypothetical protein